MDADLANLHWIYNECMNRLDSLSSRVAENRDVMAASEFARWLAFSGIPRLLKANANPEPLKVDGAHLEWKIEQLIDACNERFVTNSKAATVEIGQLESLREELDRICSNVDLMAGQIGKLTNAVSASAGSAGGAAVGGVPSGAGDGLPWLIGTGSGSVESSRLDFLNCPNLG